MAWTNFVITGAAIVAVASLMRSDIRTSTSMLRRNVKTIRKMMEDVSNGESIGEVVKKGEEEIAKKLKKYMRRGAQQLLQHALGGEGGGGEKMGWLSGGANNNNNNNNDALLFNPSASYPSIPHINSGVEFGDFKLEKGLQLKVPKVFKVLFTVWFVFSLGVLMVNMDELEMDQSRLVSVYFSAPSLMTLALWLWGINVYLWHEKMKLVPSPLVVFSEKHTKSFANEDAIPHALDASAIFGIAGVMSVATATGAACFSKALKDENEIAASFYIFFFYVLAPLVIFFAPTENGFLFGTARKGLRVTVSRIAAPTAHAISFADFFAADVLCSFAKSLSDVERVFCSAFQGHVLSHAAEGACGDQSWRIPFVLCIPSAIRLFQCIRQRRDTGDELCFWNAVKYFSAFPVIWCSALKYHVDEDDWERLYRPMWFAFAVVNSSFSYYWDLTHDWDLPMVKKLVFPSSSSASSGGGGNNNENNIIAEIESNAENEAFAPYGLRNNRLYKAPAVYYFACATNLMLRVSWTYKLAAHLRKNSRTVFFVSALEIVRRFQWSIFRIEKAYLKAKRSAMNSRENSFI